MVTNHCEHTTDGLCDRCVRLTRQHLEEIPILVQELEVTITRQARGAGNGHRKKGDDQPMPYNATASSKRSLINVLVEWSDHVAEATTTTPLALRPPVTGDITRAATAANILTTNLAWFRVNPDSTSAAQAIHNIRDQLRAAIDRPPAWLYAGPCHAELPADVTETNGRITITTGRTTKCTLDVYRRWGDDVIVCNGHNDPLETGGCGAIHNAESRREFLLESVEEQLLPLRLVWESLYVLVPETEVVVWETARKWPRRQGKVPPRLTSRLVTASGEPLYRGGDILDLARDEAPRVGRKRIRRHLKHTS